MGLLEVFPQGAQLLEALPAEVTVLSLLLADLVLLRGGLARGGCVGRWGLCSVRMLRPWFVPPPVRCEVGRAVEDLLAFRASVLDVHDHGTSEGEEKKSCFWMEFQRSVGHDRFREA